ncbi:transposase family protein [Nonomuraea jabiensis]|uniref:transposase family protein n=1 Tax=Nonomuraea jabiensis TaxID=882448 RepID=UPI0035E3FCE4
MNEPERARSAGSARKEWVTTRPRDLPVAGRQCALRWRKRRWCCDQASRPRGHLNPA